MLVSFSEWKDDWWRDDWWRDRWDEKREDKSPWEWLWYGDRILMEIRPQVVLVHLKNKVVNTKAEDIQRRIS